MIEMRINIFSKNGAIDPLSFKWLDVIITKTPEHTLYDYEKSLVKSNIQYDKLRCCELENIIHVWKNEKSLSKKQNIEEFKICFQNYFKIKEVVYDFSKFYIYKFKLQACTPGIIKKNKFTNCDIEIVQGDTPITNETQCLGLLNINQIANKIQLRVNTCVLFYITDLYN
jgi:hypothetical protein